MGAFVRQRLAGSLAPVCPAIRATIVRLENMPAILCNFFFQFFDLFDPDFLFIFFYFVLTRPCLNNGVCYLTNAADPNSFGCYCQSNLMILC